MMRRAMHLIPLKILSDFLGRYAMLQNRVFWVHHFLYWWQRWNIVWKKRSPNLKIALVEFWMPSTGIWAQKLYAGNQSATQKYCNEGNWRWLQLFLLQTIWWLPLLPVSEFAFCPVQATQWSRPSDLQEHLQSTRWPLLPPEPHHWLRSHRSANRASCSTNYRITALYYSPGGRHGVMLEGHSWILLQLVCSGLQNWKQNQPALQVGFITRAHLAHHIIRVVLPFQLLQILFCMFCSSAWGLPWAQRPPPGTHGKNPHCTRWSLSAHDPAPPPGDNSSHHNNDWRCLPWLPKQERSLGYLLRSNIWRIRSIRYNKKCLQVRQVRYFTW